MSILSRWVRRPDTTERFSFGDYLDLLESYKFGGNEYLLTQTARGVGGEPVGSGFAGLAQGALKGNGVVFACAAVRMLLFAEARFQWRAYTAGRPGDLFGTEALALLERPWPNGTTGELLGRMEQDVTLAGNAFVARRPGGFLRRLRPDWVTIAWTSPNSPYEDPSADPDATVAGYIYQPPNSDAQVLPIEDVAHYSPIPDPEAAWRGMSWLTPLVREVQSDTAATRHKLSFFENGASPNMVVRFDPTVTAEKFEQFKSLMEQSHVGVHNAYKTLYLGGGADVTVVGSKLGELDYKPIVGMGETRIAAAAGVPPVIVGLSEGLEGSSLNAGNYAQARRRLADGTMRPLWRIAAASLEHLVEPRPAGASLWYDDRHIPFLRDDTLDEAETISRDAQTVRQLVDAGYDPDAVVAAVQNRDLRRLVGAHTGLYSVQLQEPGRAEMDDDQADDMDDMGGRSFVFERDETGVVVAIDERPSHGLAG